MLLHRATTALLAALFIAGLSAPAANASPIGDLLGIRMSPLEAWAASVQIARDHPGRPYIGGSVFWHRWGSRDITICSRRYDNKPPPGGRFDRLPLHPNFLNARMTRHEPIGSTHVRYDERLFVSRKRC